jgi:Dolichyl-phosphate-mannose-protein mannosyltransferase
MTHGAIYVGTHDERYDLLRASAKRLKRNWPMKLGYLIAALILAIIVARLISADYSRPQGFDEPAHVAAGMEWLQFHTYHLDPLHPPLARLAAAIPLYLSGVRFHEADSSLLPQFWDAGNSLLYQGDYLKNLSLVRLGMLPFLALLVIVIFVWTRRYFGSFAAIAAVVLVSTLPVILSFSSLAYTDFPAACVQLCCVFAFAVWLEKPGLRSAAVLGTLFGLAILTKFTSLLYIPVTAAATLLCRFVLTRKSTYPARLIPRRILTDAALIALITAFLIWGGYSFSRGGIVETLQLEKQAVPSFQHFPSPVRGLAKEVVAKDWKVPAPSFFAGLGQVWVLDKTEPNAYLFGKFKPGGWWYFFLAETLFKTPIPFLLLMLAGCRPVYKKALERNWSSLVPAVAVLSIVLLSTAVSVNSGLRHVLVIFPLLAIIAGYGASELWSCRPGSYAGRAALACLLVWQLAAVLRPSADWIAYFNEFAGSDPSSIVVTGCDLDCGQDVLKLSADLHRRHIQTVSLALWTTADLNKMGLPAFDALEPFQPRTGWVAVSARAIREGSVQHHTYPPAAFSWLSEHTPVAHIGSTIWLYFIPSQPTALARR